MKTLLKTTAILFLTTACGGGRMQGPSGEIEPVEDPVPVTGIDAISAAAVNSHPKALEFGAGSGPVVARAQILLDRARFSVGVINGKATKNTALAIHWFQKSQNLPATSVLDSDTYARLLVAAGPAPAVARIVVDSELISGPFIVLPRGVYEQAKLRCLCYASASEKVAERFHSTIELMRKLNPGVAFAALEPGDSIWAPVLEPPTPAKAVKRIQVSKKGNYVHAFAADGSLVFHFPSTLGSKYDPSPTGKFRVTAVAWNPVYRYDPRLFSEVADHKPGALLPAGPNSPVGAVWIATSKAHIGIHGTPNPETIGFASSHGCVRLTNWDATRLGRAASSGIPVEFTV
jgi:lipoprotein-anchoring transpeptidase ErfK/SrfK